MRKSNPQALRAKCSKPSCKSLQSYHNGFPEPLIQAHYKAALMNLLRLKSVILEILDPKPTP